MNEQDENGSGQGTPLPNTNIGAEEDMESLILRLHLPHGHGDAHAAVQQEERQGEAEGTRLTYDMQTLRAIGKQVFAQRKACPDEITRAYSGIEIRRHSIVQRGLTNNKVDQVTPPRPPSSRHTQDDSSWFESRASNARATANGVDASREPEPEKDLRPRRNSRTEASSSSSKPRRPRDDPWDMPDNALTGATFQFGGSSDLLEQGRANFLSFTKAKDCQSETSKDEHSDKSCGLKDNVSYQPSCVLPSDTSRDQSEPSDGQDVLKYLASDASIDDIIGNGPQMTETRAAITTLNNSTPIRTPRFLIDVMSQGYYGDDDKRGREEVDALLERPNTNLHTNIPTSVEADISSTSEPHDISSGSILNPRSGGHSRLSKWLPSHVVADTFVEDELNKPSESPAYDEAQLVFGLSFEDLIGDTPSDTTTSSRLLNIFSRAQTQAQAHSVEVEKLPTHSMYTYSDGSLTNVEPGGSNSQPPAPHHPKPLPGQRISLQALFSSAQNSTTTPTLGLVLGGLPRTQNETGPSVSVNNTLTFAASAPLQTPQPMSAIEGVPLPAGAVASSQPMYSIRSADVDLFQKSVLEQKPALSGTIRFAASNPNDDESVSATENFPTKISAPGIRTDSTKTPLEGSVAVTGSSSRFTFHDPDSLKTDKRRKAPIVSAASRFHKHIPTQSHTQQETAIIYQQPQPAKATDIQAETQSTLIHSNRSANNSTHIHAQSQPFPPPIPVVHGLMGHFNGHYSQPHHGYPPQQQPIHLDPRLSAQVPRQLHQSQSYSQPLNGTTKPKPKPNPPAAVLQRIEVSQLFQNSHAPAMPRGQTYPRVSPQLPPGIPLDPPPTAL